LGLLARFPPPAPIYELELRRPAPRPAVPGTLGELSTFPDAFEAFVDDRLGFRHWLITLNNRALLALGVSSSPRALVGKDGWFYLRQTPTVDVVSYQRGLSRFRPGTLQRWLAVLEQRQRWLAERGIPLVVAIVPNKHTIYPEHLPDWMEPVAPTRLDQLTAALAERPDLDVVDLRPALQRVRRASQQPLYFRTDSHWTPRGAYAAYREIMRHVQRQLPQVPVLAPEQIDRRPVAPEPRDLVRVLGVGYEALWEGGVELVPNGRKRPRRFQYLHRGRWLPWEKPGTRPLASVTFESNGGGTGRPRALVFRDSFTNALIPFLDASFDRTIYTHHRMNRFNTRLVEQQQPDVVLYILSERALLDPPRDWRRRPGFRAGLSRTKG
jgi:hypothetical protein